MITSESQNSKVGGLAKKMKSLRRRASKLFKSAEEVTVNVTLPQPPFPHLLQSNTPPTESEISPVREVIATEELRLMSKNGAGSYRSTSTNLNCKLDCTHQYIAEHNAILSATRRIPPEILQNIFIHTLPTYPESISELPWALSHVCQLWRFIILSFSVMWQDLPVIPLAWVRSREKSYLDLLSEILKRSGNMPIRLIIETGLGEGYECIAHPALDLLVLHCERWQVLTISAPFSLILLPAFQRIKGRLTSLESLFLNFQHGGLIVIMYYDLFQIAPQLRHVSVLGPAGELIFPSHQLTEYRHDTKSLNHVVRVISSSPSLRKLLCGGRHLADLHAPMTPWRLPDLTVLEVSVFYVSLFDNLTIPAIEELYISTPAENVIGSICSMILRPGSPCLLKVLQVHMLQVRFPPGELCNLLSLTPLLTQLQIAMPHTLDISALTSTGNPPLVPLLNECVFWSDDDYERAEEAIPALKLFASSRCDDEISTEMLLSGAVRPLETFRIYCGFKRDWFRPLLEGWGNTDMANELRAQRKGLLDIFIGLQPGWGYDPLVKRRFKSKVKDKVMGLLTHVETLKVEEAGDIYVSEIERVIYKISIKPYFGPFGLVAGRILRKWEPVFQAGVQNARWLPEDLSLTYLSRTRSRELCSRPDAVEILYDRIDLD